jgi:hypothetical protein
LGRASDGGRAVLRNNPIIFGIAGELVLALLVKRYIGEALAQSESRQLAAPWFKDPASRPAMMKMIQNAGYPPDPP